VAERLVATALQHVAPDGQALCLAIRFGLVPFVHVDALEICQQPAQIDCEPVTRVYDNATGTAKAVVSQQNGLNVYEFGYGYTNNLLIEGDTLFSPDVWISDPTIR
jgi:hypothetical protein